MTVLKKAAHPPSREADLLPAVVPAPPAAPVAQQGQEAGVVRKPKAAVVAAPTEKDKIQQWLYRCAQQYLRITFFKRYRSGPQSRVAVLGSTGKIL